jgi:hypothetical protein
MSKQDINELIMYHFGKSKYKFFLKYLLWSISLCVGAGIVLELSHLSIFIIAFILWLIIIFVGAFFINKDMNNINFEEKLIVQIIKDDKRSKLISDDTWDKIPNRFLKRYGLR